MTSLNKKSKVVTQGDDRAPARSMLRAIGLTDEDMNKPFIGIANLASDVTPCNVHLDRIAQKAKIGVRDAGMVPMMFGTITISDGISMGTEGMKASLVTREIIADSIEAVVFGESLDGLLKNLRSLNNLEVTTDELGRLRHNYIQDIPVQLWGNIVDRFTDPHNHIAHNGWTLLNTATDLL